MSPAGIFSEVAREARRTSSLPSLFLVLACVGGAYWVGQRSPSPEVVAAQATQNERIAQSLKDGVEQQKRTADLLEKLLQGQNVGLDLARTTNTETLFVSSHYKSARQSP